MIYVVNENDTIDIISNLTGVPANTIAFDNQIEYPYALAVGQALYIREASQNIRDVFINGYAYPFVDREVLRETLKYLSYLSVFSYGFTQEGNLIPPPIDDRWMIDMANEQQVKPILTLTPFDVDGKFNNRLISALINDATAVENIILQLLETIENKRFGGVDIDFEFILAEDRDTFTGFVAEVTERLNQYGYEVSVALAPKTSAEQKGLLYEGKDYGGIGSVANSVLLMTYEWGYKYGPPMAVAPINQVRRVVEYAVTEIPVAKINLGIPNYAYDWPLPYERDVTVAETIGNIEAVRRAVKYGAEIMFDEVAKSPYFSYTDNGIGHVVWFEDVRSMEAKFGLINEYDLRGAGYWQIMRLFRANWLLLENKFGIVKFR